MDTSFPLIEAKRSASLKIGLAGGPGGGETAADLFRREIGDGVVIVPESAALLFTEGLPRSAEV